MNQNLKDELRNIISGKSPVRHGSPIQAIANYLAESAGTSQKTQDTKQIRKQEEQNLIRYADAHGLWTKVDTSKYVSEGAEQRVYLKDAISVLKLNDAIYYRTWYDYFTNLLVHNHIFFDTAYRLLGFFSDDEKLYAVVEQPYVSVSELTSISAIQKFMHSNGFELIRNNDYINPDVGIILEDLHDENVLTKDGLLYFIDTVFYLTDDFWK